MPRTGDAGLDQHAGGVQTVVTGVFLRQRRARPHYGHIAHPHVEELRQLVNGEAANEMPHLGDAWVVLHLEDEAVGLAGFFCELLLERVGVHHHRTELVHLERLAAQAHTGLLVEHRSAIRDFDGDRHRDGDNQRTDDR